MKKYILIAFGIGILCLAVKHVSSTEADTYLSEQVQGYCVDIGEEYGICPELLMAVIERESSGRADAVNGGCIGLMQVNQKCHGKRMERLGVTDLSGAYSNILVGADYLAELFEMYGDPGLVLMRYHGESDAVAKSERGEISKYARWILARSAELERLHGK